MAEEVKLQLSDFSQLYLCKHFTNISEDEKNSLVSVFSSQEVENSLSQIGSKFLSEFAKGPIDLIEKLKLNVPNKVFIQNNGRKVSIYVFDQHIGTTGIIHRNAIPSEFREQIYTEKRGESIVFVLKSREEVFTNQLVLITDNEQVITCFPGLYAPPLLSSEMTEVEFNESMDFWGQHVFICFESQP
jgi:hypothetical protein